MNQPSEHRCRCGEPATADARFCSACGAALGDASMVLGASSTVTNIATTGGVDRRWMGVAGVLFAAVIGWSIWSGGSNGSSSTGDLAEDTTGATVSTTTTTRPTTTTGPTTTTQRRTTTTSDRTPMVTVVGDGSPLLGEITGLRLVIGETSRRPSVLELDTGELQSMPLGVGSEQPVMMSGDWLVARRQNRIVALAARDLAADAVALLPGLDDDWQDLIDTTPRDDGRVWLTLYDTTARLAFVDLATGEPIASGLDDIDPYAGNLRVSIGSSLVPPLVDHAGGGIYEVDGDRYRQVANGQLVLADDQRVLTEECSERMICRRTWLDRRSWQPIELAIPPAEANQITFVNGSDWVLIVRYEVNSMSSTLFNVVTGRSYDLGSGMLDGFGQGPAVSSDGRWLAAVVRRDLVITDLETGIERTFEGLDIAPNGMLFTTADVGYASPVPDLDEVGE